MVRFEIRKHCAGDQKDHFTEHSHVTGRFFFYPFAAIGGAALLCHPGETARSRLSESRLFVESEQTVQRSNLTMFVVYRRPFAFPARLEEITRGTPTAWAYPELKDTSVSSLVADDLAPVWPDRDGTIKGRAIKLLHDGVIIAVKTDKALYALLALVDVLLRVGRARERGLPRPNCKGGSQMSVPSLGAMRAVAEPLDRVGLMCAKR